MGYSGLSEKDKKDLQSSYLLPDKYLEDPNLADISYEFTFHESKEAQLKRFEVLCEIAVKTGIPLSGSSILDMGCGLGDLYGYLNTVAKGFEYLGVDISPSYINGAAILHPQASFKEIDILEETVPAYDYVFGCGLFNEDIEDNELNLKTMVTKMADIAKVGVAFNFLPMQSSISYFFERLRHQLSNNRHIVYDTPEEVDEEDLYFYNKKKITRFCQRLDDVQGTWLVSNYIPGDVTIYIAKQLDHKRPKG